MKKRVSKYLIVGYDGREFRAYRCKVERAFGCDGSRRQVGLYDLRRKSCRGMPSEVVTVDDIEIIATNIKNGGAR